VPVSVQYDVRNPHDAVLKDHIWFLAGEFRTPNPDGGFVKWLVLRCTNPECGADAAVSESCPLSSVPIMKETSLANRLRKVMAGGGQDSRRHAINPRSRAGSRLRT
jgi:hypothetical protein